MPNQQSAVEILVRLKDESSAALQKLRESLGSVGKQTQETSKAYDKLQQTLKKTTVFKDLAKNTEQTNKAWRAAQLEVTKLAREMKASGTATKAQVSAFDSAKRKAQELKQAFIQDRSALARLRKELSSSGVDTRKLGSEMKRLRTEIDKVGKAASKPGFKSFKDNLKDAKVSAMGLGVAVAGLGAAVVAPFTAAISKASEFGGTMAMVKAVSNATEAEFAALTAQAEEMGRTTRYTGIQAGEGLRYMAMAGMSATEATAALPNVLRLAQAGQLDLGEAADITTNILTAYGKEVSELTAVNDTLVKAFTSSNSTLQELGESFKYIGPLAASTGSDFEETVGALGLLHNAGIKASLAGTSLRGALARLISPSGKAKQILSELGAKIGDAGFQVNDAEGNFVGFTKILQQLEQSGATSSQMMELFGLRAGPGMQALLKQGSSALEQFTINLKNSGGTAQEIAAVMDDTLQGAIFRMKSAFEGAFISIGRKLEPVLKVLADSLGYVVNKLTEFHEALGPFATVFDSLLLGIGALLIALAAFGTAWLFIISPLSKAYLALGGITGALGLLKGAALAVIKPLLAMRVGFVGLGSAIARATVSMIAFLATNPVGWAVLAVGAIAGLGAAYFSLKEDLDETIEKNKKIENSMGLVSDSIKAHTSAIAALGDKEDEVKKKNLEFRKTLIEIAEGEGELADLALQAAQSIDKTTGAINDHSGALAKLAAVSAEKKFEAIAEQTRALGEQLENSMRKTSGFRTLMSDTADALADKWSGFKTATSELVDAIDEDLSGAFKRLDNLLAKLKLPGFFQGAYAKTKEFFKGQLKIMEDFYLGSKMTYAELETAVKGFGDILTDEQQKMKDTYDKATAAGGHALKSIKDIVDEADLLKMTNEEFTNMAVNMGAVKDASGPIAEAMESAFNKMKTDAKEASARIAETLEKELTPKEIDTDPLKTAYEKGFNDIQKLWDNHNKELNNKGNEVSSTQVGIFKMMYAEMTAAGQQAFVGIVSEYEKNLSKINEHVKDAAEKQKLLELAKSQFIRESEKLSIQQRAQEYIAGYAQIIDTTKNAYAKRAQEIQAGVALGQRTEKEGFRKLQELKAEELVALKAHAEKYRQAVADQYGKEHTEYKAASDKVKDAIKNMNDFKVSAAKAASDKLISEIQKAIDKEKEYADKAKEYAEQARDAKATTEEKILAIRQRNMTEAQKEASVQANATKKLTESRAALAAGDAKRAEALAKQSQNLFASLKQEQTAIAGVKQAGDQLTAIYEKQQKLAIASAEEQKNKAASLKEQMKGTGTEIEALITKFEALQKKGKIDLTVSTTGANQGLAEFDTLLQDKKAEIPVTLTSESVERVQIKLKELTDEDKKKINIVLEEKDVWGKIKKIGEKGEKVFEIDLKDEKAKAAIKQLEKTTYSEHIVYVRKVEKKNLGGIAGDAVIHASGGMKLPGFSRKDTVPAMLTWGERVTNAMSTKIMDNAFPGFMDAINRVTSTLSAKKLVETFAIKQLQVRKFATGGLVNFRGAPAFAAGGVISTPSSFATGLENYGKVSLSVGGSDVPVLAQKDMVDELKKAVHREGLLRNNRR